MSLQVWLPLNKDTHNQGLLNLPTPWAFWSKDSNGKIGECYTDGAIYHIDNEWLDNKWSLACWVKSTGWSQYNDIMLCKNTSESTSSQFYFSIIGGTQLNLGVNGGSGVTSYNYTFSTNTWYHVAATYDGITICLYINGNQVKKVSYSSTKLTGMNNLCIGCRSTNTSGTSQTGNANKRLNDVRIYDHALSPKEVEEISKGLVLHYKLDNNGLGGENLILTSNKITGSSGASGITPTITDGILKVVSTSGNGNWCTVAFSQNSNTNVGNKMNIGDKYTISVQCKIENGTTLPQLFINAGNSYKTLQGDKTLNQWNTVYYTSTWADPGTSYGNISLHLGFGGAIGTYYFKNFKLEKGDKLTSWSPAPSDLNLDTSIEQDCSGYGRNGTRAGSISWSGNTPRYNVSTYFADYTRTIRTPLVLTTPTAITLAIWVKSSNTSPRGNYHMPLNIDAGAYEFSINTGGGFRQGFYVNGTRYVADYYLNGQGVLNGLWHHLCATFDGTNIKRYIDGQLVNTTAVNGSLSTSNTVYIGTYSTGTTYGNVDMYESDLRIYATALTAAQVKELYNTSMSIDSSGNIHAREVSEL